MIVEFLVLLAQATAPEAPPTTAQEPAPQADIIVPAPAAEAPPAEERVCRSYLPTGSRRPVRVCTTASEDAENEAENEGRQVMYRSSTTGAAPPPVPGR